MFYGAYEHTIDDKGRLTIPSRFRAELAQGLVISEGIDPCLWLWPKAKWDQIAAQVGQLPWTKPEVRELRRALFSGAVEGVPDKQGRVNVPDYLLEYANINKQAIVIGQYDYCEIWNPEAWKQRRERSQSDPEGRAEMFAGVSL